jgi:phosphatidylserine decarboxylase
MVKEGFPYVIVAIVLALLAGSLQWWIAAAVFALFGAFFLYFFRDPFRQPPAGENIIVSAADGRVTRIDESEKGKVVSVFLSPFDVHVNRSPIGGRITSIDYVRGRKVPATSDTASFVNERNSLTIEGSRMTVVCTQIAGIVARRIVCWKHTGDAVELGERFGMIKFSSRTDLLMPPEVTVVVKIGDRVRGGETVIARLP